MIKPGDEIEGATEQLAAAALTTLLADVRAREQDMDVTVVKHRVAEIEGDPERDAGATRVDGSPGGYGCPTAATFWC